MKEKKLKKRSAERPNVVFLIADDHRGDAIRVFGDETVHTPVLDSLVRQRDIVS